MKLVSLSNEWLIQNFTGLKNSLVNNQSSFTEQNSKFSEKNLVLTVARKFECERLLRRGPVSNKTGSCILNLFVETQPECSRKPIPRRLRGDHLRTGGINLCNIVSYSKHTDKISRAAIIAIGDYPLSPEFPRKCPADASPTPIP